MHRCRTCGSTLLVERFTSIKDGLVIHKIAFRCRANSSNRNLLDRCPVIIEQEDRTLPAVPAELKAELVKLGVHRRGQIADNLGISRTTIETVRNLSQDKIDRIWDYIRSGRLGEKPAPEVHEPTVSQLLSDEPEQDAFAASLETIKRLHGPAKQIEAILEGVSDAGRLFRTVADLAGLEKVQQCLKS